MLSRETYAEEHRSDLKSGHPKFLESLRKSGNLASYLQGVGEDAAAREHTLLQQSLKELRNQPSLDLMQELASRREAAKELVRNDLIYQPAPKLEDDERSRATPKSTRTAHATSSLLLVERPSPPSNPQDGNESIYTEGFEKALRGQLSLLPPRQPK
jgi:hypothetical protein